MEACCCSAQHRRLGKSRGLLLSRSWCLGGNGGSAVRKSCQVLPVCGRHPTECPRYVESGLDVRKRGWCSTSMCSMSATKTALEHLQDFHLAKRHYDLALETNAEASFPVYLSLIKLYARSIWHTLTGGEGGLSLWALDEEEQCRFLPPSLNLPDL